jgi:four helix bundle protein
MVSKNFRAYQQAVAIHRRCQQLRCPAYLENQLLRAASSICLNLAEGSGKSSQLDQRRFFLIAMGSVREVQAVMDLLAAVPADLVTELDRLGGSVYRLCHPRS